MLSSSATFSLVLKLAAATLSGATLLLSWRKVCRDDILFRLRRDVLRRSSSIAPSPPPSILVIGPRSHGKSAFINSACRVMAAEEGLVVLRSETAPIGSSISSAVTRSERVVRVVAKGDGEAEEEVVVAEMIDTPGFSGDGDLREEVETAVKRGKVVGKVECVVVVMRCLGTDTVSRKASAKMVGEIAAAIHDRGLLPVIVLTHKSLMKNVKNANDLRDEVAVTAMTDTIYLMDCYTAGSADNGECCSPSASNSFDTHFSVLSIMRQCMEFAMMHRSQQP